MTSYSYKNFYKYGDKFSITGKFADWIGNPTWKEGYELISNSDGYINEYTPFWEFVSALADDEGSKIYSKIKHFVQNVRDIDICELYYLKAIADELGYSGDLSYLTYDYPLEIAELLNIFSINKDLLIKTNKVLYSDSRDTLYLNTSAVVPNDIFDAFVPSGLTPEAEKHLLELSGDTSKLLYTNDEEYQELLDSIFEDCLTSFINMRYREDEDLPLSATLPIWKHIPEKLSDDNLYSNPKSNDKDIEQRKVELRINIGFNEKDVVDKLQKHLVKLSDYTIPEQEIISMEFDRREKERTKYKLISRYSPERETKVKDYFLFVDMFNSANNIDYMGYESDYNLFEVTSNGTPLLTTSGTDYVLNTYLIKMTAVKLRNIALRTSYLREELKRLVRKYNVNGSELIISILIKDLLRKYAYNTGEKWRYSNDAGDQIVSGNVSENPNFEIDVIEYFDGTEYLNISTELTPSGANEDLLNLNLPSLNEQYWSEESDKINEITKSQITDFYKNVIRLNLNTTDENYEVVLDDFLSHVYNKGATVETRNTITTETTAMITSGTPLTSGEEIFNGSWLHISNWNELHDGVITSATIDGKVLSAVDGTIYDYVDVNNIDVIKAYISGASTSEIPGSLVLSGQSLTSFDVGDLYILTMLTRRDGISPTQMITISGKGLEASGIYEASGYDSVRDEYYSKFIENSAYATPVQLYFPETTGVFEQTQAIFMPVTSGVDDYKLVINGMNPSGEDYSAYIASATYAKVEDLGSPDIIKTSYIDNGSDAFFKYTGLPDGWAPYANWKNSYHSSYAIHPFLPNIYEAMKNDFSLNKLINYESDTFENSYLPEFIGERIDANGNTIDSWRDTNIENVGYQTVYESKSNLNNIGVEDEKCDIDGPFNFNALNEFLTDPTTFKNDLINGTNEYYLNIGNINTEYIYEQLDKYEDKIRELSGKVIFKYTVDKYENQYIIYKDKNSFNDVGELWIRLYNHPIAFPGIELESGKNSEYAVLNTYQHNSINMYGSNIYDIGYFNGIMWMICENDISPKILIGQIIQEFDEAKNRNILYYTKNKSHNIELIEIPNGNKYAGTAVITNILTVVSVESDLVSGLPTTSDGLYKVNVHYDIFDPDVLGRYSKQADSQTIKYNEKYTDENTFRMEYTNELLSVAFEIENYFLLGNIMSMNPDFNSDGYTVIPLLSKPLNYSTYENGFAILDFELNDNPYGKSIYINEKNQKGIHYFYQHADLAHFGLYPTAENPNAEYEITRVPMRGFDGIITDDESYDDFKFQAEAEKSPNSINIQFFEPLKQHNNDPNIGRFELFKDFFVDVYTKHDASGIKNIETTSIYLSSSNFLWEFNEQNIINNQERKFHSNLFVHDNIEEGDLISPEDLIWTENGETRSYETDANVELGYRIYSDYTLRVTDFKKSKISITASPVLWRNE